MREVLPITKKTDTEWKSLETATITKVSTAKESSMDRVRLILFQENTNGRMALLTRVTSAKVICMERVFGNQAKETSMKAIILWMKSMALEGMFGKMEWFMKGLSKMATSQVNLQAKQKIIELQYRTSNTKSFLNTF
jgi:hypothetical protein